MIIGMQTVRRAVLFCLSLVSWAALQDSNVLGDTIMLSDRIYAVYDFIAQYHSKSGQMPTLKEIEAGIGINYTTISGYLDKMELIGMLQRPPGKVRTITLIRWEANWNALLRE